MTTAPYPPVDGTQPCSITGDDGFITQPARPHTAALCAGCRFSAPCRAYALHHDVRGIWGGIDDAERRHLRDTAGIAEPTPISDYLDAMVLAWRRTTGARPATPVTPQPVGVTNPTVSEVA